jgi:hypothetical protein
MMDGETSTAKWYHLACGGLVLWGGSGWFCQGCAANEQPIAQLRVEHGPNR